MFLSAELSTAENKMYLKFHNFILLLFLTALDTRLDTASAHNPNSRNLNLEIISFVFFNATPKKTCGCHNKFYFMTIFSILNFFVV